MVLFCQVQIERRISIRVVACPFECFWGCTAVQRHFINAAWNFQLCKIDAVIILIGWRYADTGGFDASVRDGNTFARTPISTANTCCPPSACCRYGSAVDGNTFAITPMSTTNACSILSACSGHGSTVDGNVLASTIISTANACSTLSACGGYGSAVDGNSTAGTLLSTAYTCCPPASDTLQRTGAADGDRALLFHGETRAARAAFQSVIPHQGDLRAGSAWNRESAGARGDGQAIEGDFGSHAAVHGDLVRCGAAGDGHRRTIQNGEGIIFVGVVCVLNQRMGG